MTYSSFPAIDSVMLTHILDSFMWCLHIFWFAYAMCMEYDCYISSKYLVFQIKNLAFQSKYLVFQSKTLDFDQNTRYFDSEILKY